MLCIRFPRYMTSLTLKMVQTNRARGGQDFTYTLAIDRPTVRLLPPLLAGSAVYAGVTGSYSCVQIFE